MYTANSPTVAITINSLAEKDAAGTVDAYKTRMGLIMVDAMATPGREAIVIRDGNLQVENLPME